MERTCVVLVALCVLAGCSGAKKKPKESGRKLPPLTPKELKLLAAQVSEKQVFAARYNPTECGCLAVEVRVGELWIRVAVEDASRELPGRGRFLKKAEGDSSQGVYRDYFFVGTLEDELRPCERGHVHLVFLLRQFSLDRPPLLPTSTPHQ